MALIEVRGLSAVRDALAVLRKATSGARVYIETSQDAVNKLGWLEDGGRDFMAVNATMVKDMALAATKAAPRALFSRDTSLIWRAAAEAFLERLKDRIGANGLDIRGKLRPLKPETVERKGHARVGIDTGELLKAILRARIVIRTRE